MSRSRLACRQCRAVLAYINQSGACHLAGGASIVFVDRDADQVTVRCPSCGERVSVRARRIDSSG